MKISLPSRVHQSGSLMVLVTGGRSFNQEFPVFDALDQVEALCDTSRPRLEMQIVQGGAQGADRLARQWAGLNYIRCRTERAEWHRYGRSAGPRRNQAMIDGHHPDICIAMPGGAGTNDMVTRCNAAGIPVFAYQGEDDERPGR